MEFRRFLHPIVLLPAQIVRTARRVIYRIMSYNGFHEKAVKLFLKFISHFFGGRWDRASIRTRYVGPCFDPLV